MTKFSAFTVLASAATVVLRLLHILILFNFFMCMCFVQHSHSRSEETLFKRLLVSDLKEEWAAEKQRADDMAAAVAKAEEEKQHADLAEKLAQSSSPPDVAASVCSLAEAAAAAVTNSQDGSSINEILDLANHEGGPAVSLVNDLGPGRPFDGNNDFNGLDSSVNLSTHADLQLSPLFSKDLDGQSNSPEGAVMMVDDGSEIS